MLSGSLIGGKRSSQVMSYDINSHPPHRTFKFSNRSPNMHELEQFIPTWKL